MDIPARGSRPLGLPSIQVEESSSLSRHSNSISRSSSYASTTSPTSIPMSIPNSREPIPPPLPPPKHLADIASGGRYGPDIAWKWGNSVDNQSGWGGSFAPVTSDSSSHGAMCSSRRDSVMEEQAMLTRRPSSTATIKTSSGVDKDPTTSRFDEGYHSLSGTSVGSNRSSHDARSFQGSVHAQYRNVQTEAYDKSLLQKLNSRRGSDNKTPPRGYAKPAFNSSVSDSSPTARIAMEQRHQTQLKPLSLPIITSRANPSESQPARWTDTPLSSAVSPGHSYPRFPGSGSRDYTSTSDSLNHERSSLSYSRASNSGSLLSSYKDESLNHGRARGSFDARVSPDNDEFHEEESRMKRLRIGDHPSRYDAPSQLLVAGQKRRASSPPIDGHSLHTASSASDLYRRRESAARLSPGTSYHGAIHSMSSIAPASRNNSYASTMSHSTGSITSLGSYDKVSPGGISPNTEASGSPYAHSMSLTSSSRGSLSRQGGHQRGPSDGRPSTARRSSENTGNLLSSSAPRMQGSYLCECCPKKPKKFDTQEDLNAHEQEKQYECAYCKNRFKNKNEAERHQNSLHLRRHSWSCAALAGYEAVFHVSTTRAEADTCGFCGEDFVRTGISSPSQSKSPIPIPSERDWEIRIMHLQEMHKFGECNHAKKFFRADHFRQHLKHSHAGTSGKWTNMLENACMKDEPLPEPIRQPERINPTSGRVGMISEEDELC